jgi:peptidoglycan hydrolase CwlO-like protein
MEANTVVLALGEYNALRDFKTNLEKGNTYRYIGYQQVSNYASVNVSCFVTTDEAVKEAAEHNERLVKEISDLQGQITELKQPPAVKEKSIEEIKKMSMRQFLKWRNE